MQCLWHRRIIILLNSPHLSYQQGCYALFLGILERDRDEWSIGSLPTNKVWQIRSKSPWAGESNFHVPVSGNTNKIKKKIMISSALMYSCPSLVLSSPRRSSPVKFVGRIRQGRLANNGKSKMAAKSPTIAKFSKKWKERRKEFGILLSKFASKHIELWNNFLLRNRWSRNFLTIDSLKSWTDSENWPGEETVPALLNEIPGSNPSLLYYLDELTHGAKLSSSKMYMENNLDSENAAT